MRWWAVMLAWPGVALAQVGPTTPPVPGAGTAQGDLQVTIYNNDVALIEDARTVALPAGRSRQEFADVSASIRPETVTLGGDGFGIVEQNFDYDLLSPTALMQKAVGQQVTLLRTNPATGVETRTRATVLAANGGVVLRIGEQIEVLRDDGLPVRVIFDTIPPNLRARPTLSVTVEAARAGTRPMTLSYLTRAMSWRADYVALFDERAGKLDMQGWITLNNTTGTSFANARTTLVAGEVGQLQQGYQPRRPVPQGNSAGTESGKRERLGDLYLYPIAGRTTIATNQQKQVSFLDASGVSAGKAYEYRNEWLGTQDDAQSAASVLKFSAARAGGIGDALPAGTVRVYMRDTQGRAQFVGEVAIPHTPAGSRLALRTGDAFDVKVQPVMEKREKISADEWERAARWRLTNGAGTVIAQATSQSQVEYWRTTMRYVVTNARPEPVTVDVVQGGLNRDYGWRATRVPTETMKGEQLNADERLWHVPVPANGKAELVVSFDTRY